MSETPVTEVMPESAAPPRDGALLAPDFLRRLEHLSILLTRTFAGQMHGERRSPRRGSSVEFADFRNYAQGDDLRYVDWNAYARLEKLFLKLYLEEEDLHLHLLLDTSRSMGYGTPDKLHTAKRICAALGYITLSHLDRVTVTPIAEHLGMPLRQIRGKANAPRYFQWLDTLHPAGATDFAGTLRAFAQRARRAGMVVVVSDFLGEGIEAGVRALVGRHFAVTLLQVLAPDDVSPTIAGDVRLVDAETGAAREVSITSGLLRRYAQRLATHQRMLDGLGARYGVNIMRMVTHDPFEQFILRYLRARRLVG